MALHTGTVEAQGRDSVNNPLDVEHTLIAPLAGLGLGKVPGFEGDWFHFSNWDQNLLCGHKLGTVLREQTETLLVLKVETRQGQNLQPVRTFLIPGGSPKRRAVSYLWDMLNQ